jgi:hypothetical protein
MGGGGGCVGGWVFGGRELGIGGGVLSTRGAWVLRGGGAKRVIGDKGSMDWGWLWALGYS